MAKTKPKPIDWKNRIVEYGEMPADQFLAHELNARRHPAKQREALRGSLNQVGWVAPVIVSKRTGKILDGHARVEEALSKNEHASVPYVEVDVTENEERAILATFDPITGLARYDANALESLLSDLTLNDPALVEIIEDLRWDADTEIIADIESDGRASLNNGEGFIKCVISVHNLQIVEQALIETGIKNRGDALTEICKAYLDAEG